MSADKQGQSARKKVIAFLLKNPWLGYWLVIPCEPKSDLKHWTPCELDGPHGLVKESDLTD